MNKRTSEKVEGIAQNAWRERESAAQLLLPRNSGEEWADAMLLFANRFIWRARTAPRITCYTANA